MDVHTKANQAQKVHEVLEVLMLFVIEHLTIHDGEVQVEPKQHVGEEAGVEEHNQTEEVIVASKFIAQVLTGQGGVARAVVEEWRLFINHWAVGLVNKDFGYRPNTVPEKDQDVGQLDKQCAVVDENFTAVTGLLGVLVSR